MKHNKLGLFLLIIALLTSGTLFAGGGNRNGTAGATQLLIPVGTRGIAMGGATLTNGTGIESIFYNPANLSKSSSSVDVIFSHMTYIADIGVSYGAVGASLGSLGSIALSIKSLDIGDIERTTVENPDGSGASFSPQYTVVGFTYSKTLSDRIAVGLTANLVSEKLDQVTATGLAFNIGITYQNLANIDGLSLAVVIKNLGTNMKYEGSGLYVRADVPDFTRPSQYYLIEAAEFEMPSTLEMGLGYDYQFNESNSLVLAGTFVSDNYYEDEIKIGGEYNYDNLLFLRGGYQFFPDMDSEDTVWGLTAGFGLQYDLGGAKVKIDYAYREAEFFDASHIFSIGVGL